MVSENEEFSINLSVRQTEALDALECNEITEVLYGGAKCGGKSVFICYYAVLYAIWVITLCKIFKKPKYAYVIGFIGRVRAVDFSKTTLVTWKKFIPSSIYSINEQKKEVTLFEKVIYHYGGLDDESTVNKFNSGEYGIIIVDQAEEMNRDQAAMLRGTQGRASINGVMLPIKILFSANPAECFLKDDFGISQNTICPSFRKFIKALPSDNTFIDSELYIAQLNEAWKHHPEILKAYVEGDWQSLQGSGFLIDNDTCQRIIGLQLQPQTNKCWLSCDPAWLGTNVDEIVWYVFEGNRVIDSKFSYNQETTHTAADGVKLLRQYNANCMGIDCIGVGAGVVSDCRQILKDSKQIDILGVNSSLSPKVSDEVSEENKNEQPKILYANYRAEQYWTATQELKDNKWILPNDTELIRQLCAVKYFIKNGKIQIESKEDIKSRIGRSPDRADAFVQGIWLKRFVRDRALNRDYNNIQPKFSRGRFR